MVLRSVAFAAAALMIGAAGAVGQSVGRDLENGIRDVLHIWTAPSRVGSEAILPVLTVAGTMATLMLVDESVYHWLQDRPDALPNRILAPFGENSPLNLAGRNKVLLPGSALLYIAGQLFDSPDLRDAGIGCASSAFSTAASRTYLSRLIGRARPSVGTGAFDFRPLSFNDWERRSFPGGHAAHLMSCVSFWTRRYEVGLAKPVLYALAMGVGWARVADSAHWPSDSFVGQSYGWVIGRGVADRSAERRATHAGSPVVVLTWRVPLP